MFPTILSLRPDFTTPDLHETLRWIFGSPRTPTITLGSLVIPGQILPILASVIFIYHKTSSHGQVKRAPDVEKGKPGSISPAKTNQLEFPNFKDPEVLRKYFTTATSLYHIIITYGLVLRSGLEFLPPHGALCVSQAIILILYTRFMKPSTKRMSLAAASGWLLMALLDRSSEEIRTPAICLTFLLACPVAWQTDGKTDLQQDASSLLLMMMCTNRLLFVSQEQGKHWFEQHHNQLRTVYILALILPNAWVRKQLNRQPGSAEVNAQQSTSWSLQDIAGLAKSLIKGIACFHLVLGAIMGPALLSMIVTGFLTACLPWTDIWTGFFPSKCSCEGPPVTLLFTFLAGFMIQCCSISIAGMVNIVGQVHSLSTVRADEQLPSLAETYKMGISLCISLTGWTFTIVTGLWMALATISRSM